MSCSSDAELFMAVIRHDKQLKPCGFTPSSLIFVRRQDKVTDMSSQIQNWVFLVVQIALCAPSAV